MSQPEVEFEAPVEEPVEEVEFVLPVEAVELPPVDPAPVADACLVKFENPFATKTSATLMPSAC